MQEKTVSNKGLYMLYRKKTASFIKAISHMKLLSYNLC